MQNQVVADTRSRMGRRLLQNLKALSQVYSVELLTICVRSFFSALTAAACFDSVLLLLTILLGTAYSSFELSAVT